MEIDRSRPRQADQLVRQQSHVGNAEQVIKWMLLKNCFEISPGVNRPHAARLCPTRDFGLLRDHSADHVSPAQEHIAALNRNRVFTDDEATEIRHSILGEAALHERPVHIDCFTL